MDRFRSARILRLVVGLLTAIALFLGPFAEQALAQPAEPPGLGAGAGLPVAITGNVPETVRSTYSNILTEITRAGVVAFFNALQTFAGQIAYDAATYIASGGQGQEAVFFKKGFGGYLQDVASSAAGDFIGSLSDSSFFKNIGFDLCKPKDPRLLANIQINLGAFFPGQQGQFSRPKPSCDFQTVVQNYQNVYQTMSNQDVFKNVNVSLSTSLSDIGTAGAIYDNFLSQITSKVDTKTRDRVEGQGFKNVSGQVSENTKTPSQLVREQTAESVIRQPNQTQLAATGAILNNAFSQGPIQLATYTASVFLNTLTSKFLKRIFEKGLDAFNFSDVGSTSLVSGPDTVVTAGKTDARNANIDLRTPNLQKVSDFEIVSELQACPTSGRGLWNCTIDQPFAQAIQTQGDQGGFTIGEALQKNLLHGDWKLIPNDVDHTKENQDPNCYSYAYCAANVQKLRVNRILPVGFEFAANSEENVQRCSTARGCVTLQEVVDGFSVCDPKTGGRSASSPWCHLIDPNWVITAVPQQCVLSGYGESLLSEKLDQRKQECQDIQTCLQRDNKGQCVGGYGYCLADKTVYRFTADECPARYASCRNYQSRTGQAVSFLRNTLDYAQCSADNVGCLWYATQRTPAGDAWIGTTSTGPRMYFDSTLQPCDASNEGCTKLYQATVGQPALNLIINPSFERATGTTPVLTDWISPGLPNGIPPFIPKVNAGLPTFDQAATAEIPSKSPKTYEQRVAMVGSRMYTVSLYARSEDGGDASVGVNVVQYRDETNPVPDGDMVKDFRSAGCVQQPSVSMPAVEGLTNDWQRFECSFATASSTRFANIVLKGSDVLVDALQLEEGEYATGFVDGINTQLPVVSMKIAPDDLACTGSDNDPQICSTFAKVCRQSEAGCQGYTDVQGGAEIPAMITKNDLCNVGRNGDPFICVGYAEYRKSPSAFDLVHDVDPRFDDPSDAGIADFIPKTAALCQQADVGCEEFTNVDAAAQGGEQTARFTYVRACEKPDANSQTYFTWEGSDTTGFQLKTWSLKKAGAQKAFDATPGGPEILLKRGPDQATFKEPESCGQATWTSGQDPDCRQFYDADGNVFYRYYSQTILSTDQCVSYRLDKANINDCQKTGGIFNSTTGECIYHVYEPESRTCSAQALSCRAYAGVVSGNSQTVLTQNFRDGIGTFTNGDKSSESLLVGDSSLRLIANNQASVETSVLVTSTDSGLYQVSFWVKSPLVAVDTLLVKASEPDGSNSQIVGTVKLTPDWQRFSLGPFTGAPKSAQTKLTWIFASKQAGNMVEYLDEVSVTKIQDVVYARQNSWVTPDECDRSPEGVPQPQAMLGCREYTDRRGQKLAIRQFTRLCQEQAIGCTAYVDTRNSNTVGAQTFTEQDNPPIQGFGSAVTVRPGARYIYVIDDPSKHCQPENASCRAFGKPNFDPTRGDLDKDKPFTTVYYKDDITQYGAALCKPSEIFCEAFTSNSGKANSTEYFRDPQNHLCEYRENVSLGPQDVPNLPDGHYTGWFIKGSNAPCYPGFVESGTNFGLVRVGDGGYDGWAGTCPQENGECTEYRDPNDTSDPLHTTGKPYYFIHNENFDETSCSGGVDLGGGCILLRDMSNSLLSYNVSASYAKYRLNNFKPTAPVDCSQTPLDPTCVASKTCIGTRTTSLILNQNGQVIGSPAIAVWNGPSCTTDQDCVKANDQFTTKTDALLGEHHEISYSGTCKPTPNTNDANVLVKVNIDRDCAQWLGCKTAETVYDPATRRYKDICTNLQLCDQASQKAGDIFCAHYVDRSSTSSERTLTQGAYFDINQYTNRKIGLGEKDYSGYSIPNAFQVMDLVSTRVAADGIANNTSIGYKFALDYRLAAAVPIPVIPDPNQANHYLFVPDNQVGPDQAVIVPDPNNKYGGLKLCRHVGSGLLGYYRQADVDTAANTGASPFCYLPVHGDSQQFNFPDLAQRFATDDSGNDPALREAFPPAACRAYPEADSPYPASYVTEWDTSKNPPKATTKIDGFTNANTCEYGEQCSCAYKRAEYSTAAVKKFYDVYSQNVPPGVCQGGPRDGQSCLPETIFKLPTNADPNNPGVKAAEGSNASQTCGPPEMGGRCVAFSKVEIVRGVFGQCLEEDNTRILGGDLSSHPCMTWNPTPILFGDKDAYHFVPTAGYLPPENSGQYYCLSPSHPPTSQELLSGDFIGHFDSNRQNATPYAGQMVKFDYDDDFTSDGHGGALGGDTGADLLDQANAEGPAAAQCEDADGGQSDGGNDVQANALRLVGTGRDTKSSYTETFFRLSSATHQNGYIPEQLSGTGIAFFKAEPALNPNGKGRLGCGYQADWVDGMGKLDYGNEDDVAAADKDWRDKFLQNYDPTITRGSEAIVPLPADATKGLWSSCLSTDLGGKHCYLKTWETDYRSQGQETFLAANQPQYATPNDNAKPFNLELLRNTPFAKTCSSDKPYFSIRAVFETPSENQNLAVGDVPDGPWRFVGFWVSACAGNANDLRFIYMTITMQRGDICQDLAEVRSRDSHQDAAFTDRVWSGGNFTVPGVGLQYGARYSPFSSALNVKPAGRDPLFQTGGNVAGFSPLNPPSFLGSGIDTFYRDEQSTSTYKYPKDKWAYLSNLFARIYRIYRYYYTPVRKGDTACIDGPNLGMRCTPDQNNHSKDCETQVPNRCGNDPSVKTCTNWPFTACKVDADCGNLPGSRCQGQSSGATCLEGPATGKACDPVNPADVCGYKDPTLSHTCAAVDSGGPNYIPVKACTKPNQQPVPNTGTDPDSDNNICTHGIGYYPRLDLCPNPDDEFCGLIAYDITKNGQDGSLDPSAKGNYPLPTDVTLGFYTPLYLGFTQSIDGNNTAASQPDSYKYTAYYTPRPPRIAAPAVKDCASPGQCPIQQMDAFTFDGQSEGVINVPDSQHAADLRFYGWAADNQMPLRELVVDWGDGSQQNLPDARLKNHKPFCGVERECSDTVHGGGLTCQTDADCPAGAGKCVPVGTCTKNANVYCSTDADCSTDKVKDTCDIRPLFGNTSGACEQNYFQFEHLYACSGQGNLPPCDAGGQVKEARCSRDPSRSCDVNNPTSCAPGDTCVETGLAPPTGCWDDKNAVCRYTPRVLLQDNWGWCTGECRTTLVGNQLQDSNSSHVLHQYGGCYSWGTLGQPNPNERFNSSINQTVRSSSGIDNECATSYPDQAHQSTRPWIVYPGSIQIRTSGVLNAQ